MQSKPFDKSTQNGLRIKPKLKNIQNIKFINSKRFFKKSEESKSKPELVLSKRSGSNSPIVKNNLTKFKQTCN